MTGPRSSHVCNGTPHSSYTNQWCDVHTYRVPDSGALLGMQVDMLAQCVRHVAAHRHNAACGKPLRTCIMPWSHHHAMVLTYARTRTRTGGARTVRQRGPGHRLGQPQDSMGAPLRLGTYVVCARVGWCVLMCGCDRGPCVHRCACLRASRESWLCCLLSFTSLRGCLLEWLCLVTRLAARSMWRCCQVEAHACGTPAATLTMHARAHRLIVAVATCLCILQVV